MNTIEKLINKIHHSKENENYEETITYCDEILKIDPTFTSIKIEKAFSYYCLKDYDKSIEYGKTCLSNDLDIKERALILKLIAGAFFEKEDYETSITYLDKNLEITPDDEVIKNVKAESLFRLGKYDEALEIADEINDMELKAKIYLEKKEFENAIRIYDELIYTTDNTLDVLHFKKMMAKSLFKKGDYEGFIETCEEIEKISPTNTLFFFMSIAHKKLGDEENAAKYFIKTTQNNRNNKNGLLNIDETDKDKFYNENLLTDNLKWGHEYFDTGLYDEALTYYLKADDLDSKNDEVLKCVGETYFKLEEYEKSYEYFKKALEINENNQIVLFEMAFLCSIIGKPVEVIRYGNKILSEDDNYDLYQLIAMAYVDLGKRESALECLDQAIYTHPQTNYFYTIKGNLYYYLDEEENARECFEKSIEINPYDIVPYCNQIVYYKDHKQIEKAKEIYERLIENHPDFSLKFEDINTNRL